MLQQLSGIGKRILLRRDYPFHFDSADSELRYPHIHDETGIYVHVPFCKSLCPYCPYLKYRYDKSQVTTYLQALLKEIELVGSRCDDAHLGSVYFGGGTPTLLGDSLQEVLGALRSTFEISGPIAIESGPEQLTPDCLKLLRESGVSMLSVGVQSFDDNVLKALGRSYRSEILAHVLRLAADASFETLNVDLMFAVPGQSEAGLSEIWNWPYCLSLTKSPAIRCSPFRIHRLANTCGRGVCNCRPPGRGRRCTTCFTASLSRQVTVAFRYGRLRSRA